MFITLEGPEGSGKSTQIALLAAWLRARGVDVVTTREPGGTAIGDQIRRVVHDVANHNLVPTAEILLYSASRAQLVAELIRPALALGQVVLCDRYADSTFAYQGYGRGLDLAALRVVTALATGGLRPDCTFLLDIAVERGLARRHHDEVELNRMDLQALEFHQRVRAGYHELAAQEPARWRMIDADRPPAAIQNDLRAALAELLPPGGRVATDFAD